MMGFLLRVMPSSSLVMSSLVGTLRRVLVISLALPRKASVTSALQPAYARLLSRGSMISTLQCKCVCMLEVVAAICNRCDDDIVAVELAACAPAETAPLLVPCPNCAPPLVVGVATRDLKKAGAS